MSNRHTIFHHLLMIFYLELVNLIWLIIAFLFAISGFILYGISESFFKLAIGLPLILLGITVFLFKFHEIILVVVDTKRLTKICVFCNG